MPAADKVGAWKKKRLTGGHITLPSGTEVRIEIPNISEMLRANQVPNPLVKFAVDAQDALQDMSMDMEKIKEATDFMRWMVSVTVKEPELTPDDVPELPVEDTDMILEFAMRQRDTDTVGHQLHGLETVSAWQNFRRRRNIS